ncbi:hypothetical protein FBU59_002850 [Linderina macrospora]|uniref:Uncharacterized protein n=1 Tax=Linderina macrospora TaxID=4868 RepID=A0ACC1J9Y4_9FUNG|nr:hypothetical protein FBU59_002850 [Linderina macrospora]
MRTFLLAPALAALAIAAPAVNKRQQVGSSLGDAIDTGSNAISSPNVNQGTQIEDSIIDNGFDGGNTFAGNIGSTFTKVTSNSVNKGNIVVNPSTVHTAGNTGETTNGVGNQIGDNVETVPFLPGFWAKRAIVTRSIAKRALAKRALAKRGGFEGGVTVVSPDFVGPADFDYFPGHYLPVGFPVDLPIGFADTWALAPGASHNQLQDATIVQNQV